MADEVYICYDERDLEMAKKVCDTLEGNGLDCWLKNRDTGAKHMVDEIMNAIKKSKVMVLLYSQNSKDSNFVNNEVDIAFAEKRSILVFQIDDSKLDGSLEFFLRNKPRIQAYPNPEDRFDRLVQNTSKLVKEQSAIDRNIVNIIKSIVSVVLIIISLAFIFIEGRLLLSLDWIVYNSPFMSFIMYFCRFLAALIIGVIGVLEIINLFKKNNKLSLIILFSNSKFL